MATYSLKLFIDNCGKTAADKDVVTILTACSKSPAPYPLTLIDYRLAAIQHYWHNIVCYGPSRSSTMMSFESQYACDFL